MRSTHQEALQVALQRHIKIFFMVSDREEIEELFRDIAIEGSLATVNKIKECASDVIEGAKDIGLTDRG
jgi:hypothetical protein